MAESKPPDQLDLGDDEDVVWEGSPLHEYLCQEGLASDVTAYSSASETRPLVPKRMANSHGLANVQWPQDVSRQELEIEVAQKLLSSELLVQEDEDFISNFILTDEALEALKNKSNHPEGRSFLGDALLFSGSLVAVAGTVLYLSERTRLAATAAAILPTALAALSSARSSKSKSQAREQEQHFLQLIEQLLSDMKMFKQLVRKSLNLLQGMELMHSGYMFAVNSSTGGAAGTSALNSCPTKEDSPLTKALSERASFPALRKAVYQSARDMIKSYREAVTKLMEIGPLADHVDLKEHYIAFIDLAHFGIEEGDEIPDESVSVRALKDVVQLTLIQQSEYLRRFSLAFCEKAREDHKLDEVGVVSQVKNLVSSIRKINSKLGQVFDYHQAMGLLSEKKSQSLLLSRRQKIDLLPLRSIYTSLFSTGLHLQNSLLKIRDLEKHFDHIEQSKTRDTDMFAALLPSDEHLLEWLKGFQAVQSELNACVGCLDEGVSQIDFLQAKDQITPPKLTPHNEHNHSKIEKDPKESDNLVKMSVATSTEPVDEVFEAVIPKNGTEEESHSEGEDPIITLERKKRSMERMQSDRVLDELRHVLVEKAAERERREALALARMHGPTPEETDREAEEVVVTVQKCSKPKLNAHSSSNTVNGPSKPPPDAWTPISVKSKPVLNGISSGFDDEFCRNDFDTLRSSNGALQKQGSPRGSEASTSSSSDPATVRSVRNYGNESLSNSSSSNSSLNNSSLNDSSSDSELDDLWSTKRANGHDNRRPLKPRTGSMPNGLKAAPSLGSLPKLKAMKSSPLEGPVGSCSLAELRCLSSPDITRLMEEDDSSNPYVSFEDLKKKAKPRVTNLSDSDSEYGSADEMQHQVLKTYRRPLRPAALKSGHPKTDSSPQPDKIKAKRLRNRTISIEKQENGGSISNGELNGHSQSSYVSKNHSESSPLFLPSRPVGFNASLAAQAAAKAMNGFSRVTGLGGSAFDKRKEEVFGSDSD